MRSPKWPSHHFSFLLFTLWKVIKVIKLCSSICSCLGVLKSLNGRLLSNFPVISLFWLALVSRVHNNSHDFYSFVLAVSFAIPSPTVIHSNEYHRGTLHNHGDRWFMNSFEYMIQWYNGLFIKSAAVLTHFKWVPRVKRDSLQQTILRPVFSRGHGIFRVFCVKPDGCYMT